MAKSLQEYADWLDQTKIWMPVDPSWNTDPGAVAQTVHLGLRA